MQLDSRHEILLHKNKIDQMDAFEMTLSMKVIQTGLNLESSDVYHHSKTERN